MRVHFIDVGQGAATLVELPCGAMLVDTGGEDSDEGEFHSRAALSAYLEAFFTRRTDLKRTLDVLLLTHPHIDHLRGALDVLDAFTVRSVVDNGQTPLQEVNREAVDGIRAWLEAHPTTQHLSVRLADFPDRGAPFTSALLDPFPMCKGTDPSVHALWGQVESDPGWGEDDYNRARFDNENNHSVVTRVDFGGSRLLILGDLEAVAQEELVRARAPADLDADLYVVGHHGSANGTTRALLDVVTPEVAVIEMGPSTRHGAWTAYQYGHPRLPVMDLLATAVTGVRPPVLRPVATAVKQFIEREVDRAIYATGWEGSMVFEADAAGRIARIEGSPAAEAR